MSVPHAKARPAATDERPGPKPPWLRAPAAAAVTALVPLVAVVVLAAAGQLTGTTPDGLRDPGALTRWGLPLVTGVRDAAAALTIGLFTLAVLTMQSRETLDTDDLGPRRLRVVRLAGATAAVWAASGVALVLLTYSEVAAIGIGRPGFGAGVGAFVLDVELGRLLAGGCVLVASVAVGARLTTQFSTTVILALVAAGALLPVALAGHSAGEEQHASAVNSLFAHLLGVAVWTGGLAGLVILRVAFRDDVVATVRRFSALAGAAFAVVTVSGFWRLITQVESLDQLAGAYGAIVAAKVVALLALAIAGWAHRRRTIRQLGSDPGRWAPFLRLVAVELLVMAVAMGLGVALARTPLA